MGMSFSALLPLKPVIRFQVTTIGDYSSNMLQLVDDKKPTPGPIHSRLNSPCFFFFFFFFFFFVFFCFFF